MRGWNTKHKLRHVHVCGIIGRTYVYDILTPGCYCSTNRIRREKWREHRRENLLRLFNPTPRPRPAGLRFLGPYGSEIPGFIAKVFEDGITLPDPDAVPGPAAAAGTLRPEPESITVKLDEDAMKALTDTFSELYTRVSAMLMK